MKAALRASDQHFVTAVSATWIMASVAVEAKKRRRTFDDRAAPVLPLPRPLFLPGRVPQRPETYRAVADANAWLTVEESKILQGTCSAMTVAGLADRWLASNPLMRDSSRSRDASTVKQYIKPVIGLLKVAGPTKVTLQGLVDNWTAVDHLAPSTVHRMASTLHALFQYAVDDKKRLDNPADDLKLPEVAQGDMVELTLEDYGRLAQALGPGHSTFMWLGAETGLRWGECAGITLGDLDLGAATLRVSLQLDRDQQLSPPRTRPPGPSTSATPWWQSCPSTWSAMV